MKARTFGGKRRCLTTQETNQIRQQMLSTSYRISIARLS